ncbi:hypothetical protein AURDEDRAFT_164239 [Auricularia subglabra TFB-10046 SS5]|nr:hypothetical protein AURDEDRAFT_164239 [Auricularia subglabra TFB-10046 SS5]
MPNKQYQGKLPLQIGGPRRVLEPLIRNRVKDTRPGIEYVHGTVTGFVLGEDNAVRAVTVRKQDGSSTDIDCALVIDCTGLSQSGLKLLARTFPTLPQLRANYNPQMNYASLDFPLPPKFNERVWELTYNKDGTGGSAGGPYDREFAQFMFMIVPDPRDDFRCVNLCRQADNGLVYAAGGWGCELPVSLDQLREHMRQIKGKKIPDYAWTLVDMVEPVADRVVVNEAHITSCSRIHYERAGDILPHNFVAVGDAVMRLNPLYGEGVNKVAVGVATLDGVLRSYSPHDRAFGRTFFKRLANRSQDRWESSKALDYGHQTTIPVPGETLDVGWFLRWYNRKLGAILHKNEYAAGVLWHSMHFLGPGQLMMSPRILAAVIWEMIWPTQ